MLPSLAAALGLSVVHLYAGRLRFIDVIPRSRLLSFAGGISVAYVFLRLLPDLARSQARVGYTMEQALHIPRDPVFFMALLGVVVFYGLERLAERSRKEQRITKGDDCPTPLVFWISIGSYSVVNFAVGYLLVYREAAGMGRLSLLFLAMALWFVVSDYALRAQYRDNYRAPGRWILAGSVLLGWTTATATPVPDSLLSIAVAFVAGGVVMNVLKEELPRERESAFWAFALGAGMYSALLMGT